MIDLIYLSNTDPSPHQLSSVMPIAGDFVRGTTSSRLAPSQQAPPGSEFNQRVAFAMAAPVTAGAVNVCTNRKTFSTSVIGACET